MALPLSKKGSETMRRRILNVTKRNCAPVLNALSVAAAALLCCSALLAGGCSQGMSSPPPPPPQTITVNLSRTAATVDVGTMLNLTASVNDPKNAGVSWMLIGGGALSNQTTTSVTYTGPSNAGSATITATAVSDTSKSTSTTVTIAPLPQVTAPAQIPPVNIGQSYSLQLTVNGGTSPFAWSVTQGQLPKGLSLDPKTGLISGTAQAAIVMQSESEPAPNAASSTTSVSTTAQVADSSTPSQTSSVLLDFQVVGGTTSALGFVYVAGDSVTSEYSIGSDGTLTLLRPQSLPGSPLTRSPGAGDQILVIDPLHRFVYGADTRGNEIHQYKIVADGTLAEMTPLTVTIGDPVSVQTTDIVMGPGGSEVYVSSNLGVHQFSVGQDGQLHQLGPPVAPAAGAGANCIAIDPSGSHIYTCRDGIDSYAVKLDGTVAFLATSPLNDPASLGHLTLASDTLLISANGDHLNAYAVNAGKVGPAAGSTGPADAGIFDLSVQANGAFAVAGDLIVPMPPGGGTNDHLSLYDVQGGQVGTPQKSDTGRGPGRVLALAFNLQTGTPPTPNPLVYVTNSRDNNVAQCIPIYAPRCPTVAIASQDKDPHGITGFLGSPGN